MLETIKTNLVSYAFFTQHDVKYLFEVAGDAATLRNVLKLGFGISKVKVEKTYQTRFKIQIGQFSLTEAENHVYNANIIEKNTNN